MAKKYETAYTEDNVSSKSFDRDASFFKPGRAAEGENAGRPKYKDYAGGLTGKTNVDPDLDSATGGRHSMGDGDKPDDKGKGWQ